MRLLNVKSRNLEEFFGNAVPVPPYAVLSHRWGDDEVTFQSIKSGWYSGRLKARPWPNKLEGCCRQAAKDNLAYIWVDTCCIDKTNSAELGEAINSMFAWYNKASKCYAYLSDVPSDDVARSPGSMFRASNWFTRGWTLQELLAPKEVYFYNGDWRPIGSKHGMSSVVQEITGIPRAYLRGWADLHEASVAQRMSWAAKRQTTRTEDAAYCLLGLFGVVMPMIYGEKENAFTRLQQELIMKTKDHSILAWGFANDEDAAITSNSPGIHGGALATSPADFAGSGAVFPCDGSKQQSKNSFDLIGGSLRIHLPLLRSSSGQLFGLLDCSLERNKEELVGIPLDVVPFQEVTNNYVRPVGKHANLFPRGQVQISSGRELITIGRDAETSGLDPATRRNCFYIDTSTGAVELVDVVPDGRWIRDRDMITTSKDPGGEKGKETFLRFRVPPFTRGSRGDDDFVIVLVFEHQGLQPRGTGHIMSLARHVPMAELVGNFELMGPHLYGRQSCSNGKAALSVSVSQETVAGQGVFVVEVKMDTDSALDPDEGAANATQQILALHKERGTEMVVERTSTPVGHDLLDHHDGSEGSRHAAHEDDSGISETSLQEDVDDSKSYNEFIGVDRVTRGSEPAAISVPERDDGTIESEVGNADATRSIQHSEDHLEMRSARSETSSTEGHERRRRRRSRREDAEDQTRGAPLTIPVTHLNDDLLVFRDMDYFEMRCHRLCAYIRQWVLRFSDASGTRACQPTSEIVDKNIISRLSKTVLDGSDVDYHLQDPVRRRFVFRSLIINMLWEFVFSEYLFGVDRDQSQNLQSLQAALSEVGPPRVVRQWRAVTLTLLSRRSSKSEQRVRDGDALNRAILHILSSTLPPPHTSTETLRHSLRSIVGEAVDLSIEMRCQRAEYMVLPPLEPEYDANGDLVSEVSLVASLMNEESGNHGSNEELEAAGATVRALLFPLVVRKGDDDGDGDEETVVYPAQVLVERPEDRVPDGRPLRRD